MKLCWEAIGSRVMCEGSPYNKSLEYDLESIER